MSPEIATTHKLYGPVEEIRRWRLLCIARTEALSLYGHAVCDKDSTRAQKRTRGGDARLSSWTMGLSLLLMRSRCPRQIYWPALNLARSTLSSVKVPLSPAGQSDNKSNGIRAVQWDGQGWGEVEQKTETRTRTRTWTGLSKEDEPISYVAKCAEMRRLN